MEKKIFENENLVVYSPESLNYITDGIDSIFYNSLSFYKKIFDIDKYRKVKINYFDDIDKFREFIYELRGKKQSLPKYAMGTFDNGMINAYINPNIIIGSNLFYKKRFMISHELFHIMYMELMLIKNNIERIIWFDEGMAQLFSGENEFKLRETEYKNWVNNVIRETKEIPNLNEINHGKTFVNKNYNGYDLSLIMVKNIYESMSFEQFKKLMRDPISIKKYGNKLETVFKEFIDFQLKK